MKIASAIMPAKKRTSQGQKPFTMERNKMYNFNIYEALATEVAGDDDIQPISECNMKELHLESECGTTPSSDHNFENSMTSYFKVEVSNSSVTTMEEPEKKCRCQSTRYLMSNHGTI